MIKPLRAIISLFFIVFLTLTACAPQDALQETTPSPAPLPTTPVTDSLSPLAEYWVPPYYSADYVKIITASQDEDGLVVYSTIPARSWEPIIEVFNAHYPWVNISISNLSDAEAFTRYYAENESGNRSADIIISSDQIGWHDFLTKKQAQEYRSPEELFLPEWSKPTFGVYRSRSGLYTMCSDPLIIIYNKKLLPGQPNSIATIAERIASNPSVFTRQVITHGVEMDAIGLDANWFWINRRGESGWEATEKIGRVNPRLEVSDTEIIKLVGNGTAKLGYFVPLSVLLPALETYPNLGWSYINDGQPVLLRRMAVTRNAASPNSAKLMLDFILSQEGQLALDKGGLMPYRNDVLGIPAQHLDLVAQQTGNENIILFSIDERIMDNAKRNLFIGRWNRLMPQTATP